jgi:hypothetical protein
VIDLSFPPVEIDLGRIGAFFLFLVLLITP